MATRVEKEIERAADEGLTGRMAGPRPPRKLRPHEHKSTAAAGVRFMNATDPDDNVMEFHPSKREIAEKRGRKKRRMKRR